MNTPTFLQGDIAFIANNLYEELLTSGSSLLLSDVIKIICDRVRDYVAWAGSLQSFGELQTDEVLPLLIDDTTELHNDEWVILEPVIRAHCDLMQARRMEGAQNLGVNPVGMSVSEAKQNLHEALIQLQKEAFNCHPFSVSWTDKDQ